MLSLGAILFVFSAFYTIVIGAPLTRGNLLVGRIGNGGKKKQIRTNNIII